MIMAYYVVSDNGELDESSEIPIPAGLTDPEDIATFVRGCLFEGDWCPGTPYAIFTFTKYNVHTLICEEYECGQEFIDSGQFKGDLEGEDDPEEDVVYAVQWFHKHGTDMSLHATREGARKQGESWMQQSLVTWLQLANRVKYFEDTDALWKDFAKLTDDNEHVEINTLEVCD